jgi:regulatory protein
VIDEDDEEGSAKPAPKRRRKRKAKEATVPYLERVALWYLARYPGSTARVQRALEKRVRRSVTELETDPEDGARAVETVIATLTRSGLLDDARFASSRVRVLRARGLSARAIASKLRHQGIAPGTIDAALNAHAEDEGVDELEAARTFARKRRLGRHHRTAEARAERREKDLAKMARAGFSFGTAQQVIDEDEPE